MTEPVLLVIDDDPQALAEAPYATPRRLRSRIRSSLLKNTWLAPRERGWCREDVAGELLIEVDFLGLQGVEVLAA